MKNLLSTAYFYRVRYFREIISGVCYISIFHSKADIPRIIRQTLSETSNLNFKDVILETVSKL